MIKEGREIVIAMARKISTEEISTHNVLEDLWIVVDGTVYDMTGFEHPGGAEIINRYAGYDATVAYSEIHAPSLIRNTLPASKILGTVDSTTLTDEWLKPPPSLSIMQSSSSNSKPPLSTLISTHDFVLAAQNSLTPKTWAFYSSAATDLHTKARNTTVYADISFRPRILVNVKDVNTSTTMLGQKLRLPLFCAPAAMAKMVHPEGEKGLARGCKATGIAQCVSTNASFPIEEIVSSVREKDGREGMPIFFQLYVDKQREKSEKLLQKVEALGIKAIFVTVDAPVPGKREADERVAADESLVTPMSGAKAKNDSKGGALGRIMGSYIDASLSWSDIPWLRRSSKLPIVLKGVQTAMDARKAMEFGIEGIVLSNHGGRSLDTSPAPILVLLELQKCCPEVFERMEIYIDGGVMRGTDIFKALCLGATSVGIGRGFLYALNYGEEGVEKYVDILKDELETTMRMMGITDLSQVHPGLLNTRAVDHLIPDGEAHPYAKWHPKARI